MGSFFTSSVVSRKIVAMRLRLASVALLVAACSGDDGMLPVGPPGDGGKFVDAAPRDGTTFLDAPVDTGMPSPIDASIFTGRVCLVSDSRELDTCATTGAGGLTVRLGANSAATADNGSFMIAGTTAMTWSVTGTNIVTSLKKIGDYEVPAIPRAMFDDMIAQNLSTLPPNPGEGHIIAMLIRNGAPVTGATAAKPQGAAWNPFYDGDTDATHWTQTSTSANGVVWFPNIDVGTVNVSVTSGTTTIQAMALPVEDGAITFTTILFP